MTTAAATPIKHSRVIHTVTDNVGVTDDELVSQSLEGSEAAFAQLVGPTRA